MIVVDPEITRLKLGRELELWKENEDSYRRRGWILLSHEEFTVDIGFLGRVQIGPPVFPVMSACVRIDFTNYDLWPPSVEFVDLFTGSYAEAAVAALVDSDAGPQNVIVDGHPDTGRQFFCVPGIRQYHDHPQHSGDSWLLHRASRQGSLVTICDRIWRAMARNLLGIHAEIQTLPGRQVNVQFRLVNAPGDVAPDLWEQVEHAARQAIPLQPGDGPGQSGAVLAALGVAIPAAPDPSKGGQ